MISRSAQLSRGSLAASDSAWRPDLADIRTPVRAEGEQEALLYIFQLVAGAGAWLLVASFVPHRLLGELLGFVALCAAQFPFARRTWAAEISAGRYWKGVAIGTALAAGLRLGLQ